MELEPDRVVAAVAAFLGAAFVSTLTFLGILFSVPPPTRRHLMRAAAEFFTSIFGGVLAGYMLAAPAAALLNGLAAKIVPGFAAVDTMAAGLLVGSVVVKLWTPAINWLEAWLKKRAEAKTA